MPPAVRGAAHAPGARRRRAPPSPPRPHRCRALHVGGQEQFYLEGQISLRRAGRGRRHEGAVLHPAPQRDAAPGGARAGPAAHAVQVECRRMGGGFGGKESQSALFACVAAVAARAAAPVKLRVDRDDDFLITGRRHCFVYEAEVGHDDEGRILGAEVTMVSQRRPLGRPVGPVMTRALCHFDNAYWLPTWRCTATAPHEHAEQHRLPRLRRAAGRHRHRAGDRQRGPPPGPRPAGRAPANFYGPTRAQRHALRPGGGRQHRARAGGELEASSDYARGARPSPPSTPRARC
jgi:hypothetical protein